jgi:fatty acid-binding protein DegV
MAKGLIGGLLGVRPILTFRDGTVQPLAQARGEEQSFEKILELMDEDVAAGTRLRVGLVESTTCPQLDRAREHIESRYDVLELVRAPVTGVIGTHAGPEAWGIFYQIVREDDPLLT